MRKLPPAMPRSLLWGRFWLWTLPLASLLAMLNFYHQRLPPKSLPPQIDILANLSINLEHPSHLFYNSTREATCLSGKRATLLCQIDSLFKKGLPFEGIYQVEELNLKSKEGKSVAKKFCHDLASKRSCFYELSFQGKETLSLKARHLVLSRELGAPSFSLKDFNLQNEKIQISSERATLVGEKITAYGAKLQSENFASQTQNQLLGALKKETLYLDKIEGLSFNQGAICFSSQTPLNLSYSLLTKELHLSPSFGSKIVLVDPANQLLLHSKAINGHPKKLKIDGDLNIYYGTIS